MGFTYAIEDAVKAVNKQLTTTLNIATGVTSFVDSKAYDWTIPAGIDSAIISVALPVIVIAKEKG